MNTLEILTLLIGMFLFIHLRLLADVEGELSEIKDAIRERKSKDE